MSNDNVIQFPRKQVELKGKYESIDQAIERLADSDEKQIIKTECNTMSEYLRDLIEVAVHDQGYFEAFHDMEFKTLDTASGRDLFLITNLVNAMLLRHSGQEHHFHPAMDALTGELVSIYDEQKDK